MPEPTSTAAATVVAAGVTVPALSLLGVPLGLRPDLLVAGFGGALVSIILLNTVPSTGDTWRELLRTTVRRMSVAGASALTAGYLAPLTLLLAALPDSLLLGAAFVTGSAAQRVLRGAISRLEPKGGNGGEVSP